MFVSNTILVQINKWIIIKVLKISETFKTFGYTTLKALPLFSFILRDSFLHKWHTLWYHIQQLRRNGFEGFEGLRSIRVLQGVRGPQAPRIRFYLLVSCGGRSPHMFIINVKARRLIYWNHFCWHTILRNYISKQWVAF